MFEIVALTGPTPTARYSDRTYRTLAAAIAAAKAIVRREPDTTAYVRRDVLSPIIRTVYRDSTGRLVVT